MNNKYEGGSIYKRIDNPERYKKLIELRIEKMKARSGKIRKTPFAFSHSICDVFSCLHSEFIRNKKTKQFEKIYYELIGQDDVTDAKQMYRQIFSDIDGKYSMAYASMHRFLLEKAKIITQIDKSKIRELTGQKQVEFNEEYWYILCDIELILILIKSCLDLIALLTPAFFFAQQPNAQSFNKQVERFLKNKDADDKEYVDYLSTNLTWFYTLKRIRDDISHYASLALSFKEDDHGDVELVVYTRKFDLLLGEIPIEKQIKEIWDGFNNFLSFYKTYFIKKLKEN